MSPLLTLVSPAGLLDLALKSAAVMLVALLAAVLLRRSSAARRHLVWCLSASSLLLLPVLTLALPAWRTTWLPQWTAEPAQIAATGQGPIAQADPVRLLDAGPPTEIILPPSAVPQSTDERHVLPAAAVETTSPHRAPFPWLAAGWAMGVLLSLVPLAAGLWQLAALHRRSRAIDDRRWLVLLDELRRQLAVRRSVQLRESEAALAPITWGALRPVLLVPAEASAWPDERRRLVLLHELAHVRRWDWLTQLVAHVACAVYWFNPLVWLAARQTRIERERACDDLVLASGAKASDYAQELLALAAGLSNSRLSTLAAVPMARRGALEDRLRGILDNRRRRAALTRTAILLGTALAAAAIAPLAMLRAAPSRQPPSRMATATHESAQSETDEPQREPPVNEQPVAEKPAGEPGDPASVNKPAEVAQPPADKPAAPQNDPLLGTEAAQRVKKFRPSFSKAQEGIEVGISLASDRQAFHQGERVPLEFVIRNVSQKTLRVEHSLYPPETPPTVIGPDGTQLSIEPVLLLGVNRRYRNTLKPNEVAVYRHPGLGLGENPKPPGTFWNPFLKNAVPGKYRLSQEVRVTVREEGQDAGTSFRAVTGEVAFAIEPVDGAKGIVRGVVLDHAGKPLQAAAVFALGTTQLSVSAGEAWRSDGEKDNQAKPVRTDEQGRFELPTDDAKTLVVSHPQFDVWPVAIPEKADLTIRLPEPARIEVNLDIDGADKESNIWYELIASQMPEFKGLPLRSERYAKIANPGKLVLAGVVPGMYQLSRRLGRMLENQTFEIKSGELKTINYVRPKGARIRGKVTWSADARLMSIQIDVTGDTVYAALTPGEDGTFLTERIPQGRKHLVAYAFRQLTPEQMKMLGAIAPSYQAQATIEVPDEGEVTVGDLALKPIRAQAPKPAPPVKEKPAAEKPAEKPAAKPVPEQVTVRGKAVDDETGQPIELPLVVQKGHFDPADPTKVTWGLGEDRSSARDGSFSATIRWSKGWTARILAEGYIPQPVITSAPDRDNIRVTLRLKRGPKVRGVVLDHAGQPLKDAAVFGVGPTTPVNLSAGQAEDSEATPVKTDAEGRFELRLGEQKFVAVSHAGFDAWPAPIPETGELTIRLPQPARVQVELNVEGAEKESIVFYQLLTSYMPEFADSGVRSMRSIAVANPGKLTLAALPPGKYQICRSVTNNTREVGVGAMLDRQFFEVQSGESKSIDFTRKTGARVRGKITWPAGTKLSGIIVRIQAEEARTSPFDDHEWTTIYASQTAQADGAFLTERVPPGKYLLVADGYQPRPPGQEARLGLIGPSFHAAIKIEVPESGELKVGELALKAIKKGE